MWCNELKADVSFCSGRCKVCDKSKIEMTDYDGNKASLHNVKNHLIAKMNELENAEKKAIDESRVQSQIDMYHDEFMLYAGFLAQLN